MATLPLPALNVAEAAQMVKSKLKTPAGMVSAFKPVTLKVSNSWKVLLTFTVALLARFRNKIGKLTSKVAGMESGWGTRATSGAFRRTIEVYGFAISFIFRFFQTRKKFGGKDMDKEVYSAKQTELAKVLRDKLLELGPTFIKLGQLLSTRIDVLPKEYIKELVLLQDQVPGFSGAKAREVIEEQLGLPVDKIYDAGSFSDEALAAASLGQVHTASINGAKVAIKIQRAGLKELFDMDLKNIRVLALVLDAIDPKVRFNYHESPLCTAISGYVVLYWIYTWIHELVDFLFFAHQHDSTHLSSPPPPDYDLITRRVTALREIGSVYMKKVRACCTRRSITSSRRRIPNAFRRTSRVLST
jgi:hypothetical protein